MQKILESIKIFPVGKKKDVLVKKWALYISCWCQKEISFYLINKISIFAVIADYKDFHPVCFHSTHSWNVMIEYIN